MPSPVGHFLGGIAAGRLVTGARLRPAQPARPWFRRCDDLLVFGLLGALPDIDFLFKAHSTYTHSLGAVGIVMLVGLIGCPRARGAVAVAVAAAYGSHLLLDWLGDDTTPPIGIMALWPLTDGFYQSDLRWFMAISRQYWLDTFWSHNLAAVVREVVLVGPVTAVVLWLRAGRPARRSRP